MVGPFKEEDEQKANLFFLRGLIDFVCTDDLFVLVIILPSFSTPKKSEHFPPQIPF